MSRCRATSPGAPERVRKLTRPHPHTVKSEAWERVSRPSGCASHASSSQPAFPSPLNYSAHKLVPLADRGASPLEQPAFALCIQYAQVCSLLVQPSRCIRCPPVARSQLSLCQSFASRAARALQHWSAWSIDQDAGNPTATHPRYRPKRGILRGGHQPFLFRALSLGFCCARRRNSGISQQRSSCSAAASMWHIKTDIACGHAAAELRLPRTSLFLTANRPVLQ
jgi:hypothetical protein